MEIKGDRASHLYLTITKEAKRLNMANIYGPPPKKNKKK